MSKPSSVARRSPRRIGRSSSRQVVGAPLTASGRIPSARTAQNACRQYALHGPVRAPIRRLTSTRSPWPAATWAPISSTSTSSQKRTKARPGIPTGAAWAPRPAADPTTDGVGTVDRPLPSSTGTRTPSRRSTAAPAAGPGRGSCAVADDHEVDVGALGLTVYADHDGAGHTASSEDPADAMVSGHARRSRPRRREARSAAPRSAASPTSSARSPGSTPRRATRSNPVRPSHPGDRRHGPSGCARTCRSRQGPLRRGSTAAWNRRSPSRRLVAAQRPSHRRGTGCRVTRTRATCDRFQQRARTPPAASRPPRRRRICPRPRRAHRPRVDRHARPGRRGAGDWSPASAAEPADRVQIALRSRRRRRNQWGSKVGGTNREPTSKRPRQVAIRGRPGMLAAGDEAVAHAGPGTSGRSVARRPRTRTSRTDRCRTSDRAADGTGSSATGSGRPAARSATASGSPSAASTDRPSTLMWTRRRGRGAGSTTGR